MMESVRYLFLALLFSSNLVFAAGPGVLFSYEGILTDSAGNAITVSTNVTFKILLDSGGCVLYEETQSVTPDSSGGFSVSVGTSASPTYSTNSMDRIFASSGSVSCQAGGTQTVSGFSTRLLRIVVGSTTMTPDVTIGNIPFAVNAQRLNDKSVSDLVNINSGSGVTQSNVESIFNRYTKLDSILTNFNSAGTTFSGNATSATTATTATTAGNVTGTVAIANGGTGATSASTARTNLGLGSLAIMSPSGTADATTYLRGDGTWAVVSGGGSITSVNAGTGLTGGGSSGSVTLSMQTSGITAGTYTKVVVDSYGRATAGTTLSGTDIPSLDANKITSGTFADSMLVGISADKILNGAGKYINYKPNATACADGQILIYSSSAPGWICSSAGGGTLAGDVSGSLTTSSVDKIKGKSIIPIAYSVGQVLRFDGTNWVNTTLSSADLSNDNNLLKASNMPSACSASQTLTFSSPTGTWVCSTIGGLSASAITNGVLPVAQGGTGSSNGSMSTTGNLSFTTTGNVNIASSSSTAGAGTLTLNAGTSSDINLVTSGVTNGIKYVAPAGLIMQPGSCPSGYTYAGNAGGERKGLCIQSIDQASTDVKDAMSQCFSSGARLCGLQEYLFACYRNVTSLNAAFHWTDLIAYNGIGLTATLVKCSGPSASAISYDQIGNANTYRCCIDR